MVSREMPKSKTTSALFGTKACNHCLCFKLFAAMFANFWNFQLAIPHIINRYSYMLQICDKKQYTSIIINDYLKTKNSCKQLVYRNFIIIDYQL
jgi:hypothetical protein